MATKENVVSPVEEATAEKLGAQTSAFGFQNTAPGPTPVTNVTSNLEMVTNYATVAETANEATMSNKTCPLDQEELITFRSRRIPNIQTNLKVAHPGIAKDGIQYQVIVEDILRTTDSADSTFVLDEPIVAMLTIRHPYSGNFDAAKVSTIINRVISALYKRSGASRLPDLMRGAEHPYDD